MKKQLNEMSDSELLVTIASQQARTATNTGVIKVIIVIYFIFWILDALLGSMI